MTRDFSPLIKRVLLVCGIDHLLPNHSRSWGKLAGSCLKILIFSGDQRSAKHFLYDTLFFRSTRAHCMLTVLLDTWPEIFLYPNDPNILFETVIWVIYNSGPSQSCTDMKVPEVKQKLCSFRIFGPKYNGDDLIKKLIEHVEKHHADKSGNMGDVKFSRNCIDFWTNSVKIMLSESTFNLKTNLDFAEKIIQVNLDLRQISIYLKIHLHTFFGATGF